MSNKSKHTPGPLEAHQTTLLGAPCISLTTGKLFPSFICHVEGENREANAKLFIAAPDLLEACKLAKAKLDEMGCGCSSTYETPGCPSCTLNAAIAKATA